MSSMTGNHWRRSARTVCLGLASIALVAVAANTGAAAPPVVDRTAPEGAPNVVVVLLDDVGFGAASTFGGPADTPALDALAEQGLRYNRFHTTGICSPTRASLLTGRDAHAANVGAVMNSSNRYPGYQGSLRAETATVAEVLRQQGYSTAVFGKWHLTPARETSPSGPFDRWPVGLGFEKFYGFLGGETDQFEPTLYDGTTPIRRPAGNDYHLTEDLADQAIQWFRTQQSVTPDKPFFLYFATGATHAPVQVPPEWLDRYRGQFDQGWDALREAIFDRQKQLGVIPVDAKLTPRPAELPAWDSLSADEQRVASRLMEAFVAFLAHTDAQVGRLVQALKDSGEYDNTLFVYVVGDNGSSAEGGLPGSINYMGALQGMGESTAHQLEHLDAIGGPESYPQYPAGWAWALSTPFQWVKQVASHLGATRNPMVVSWPERIHDRGGLRSQFSHVNDIVPTILDAVGLEAPKTVNGVEQMPMHGSSLLASFERADAPEHHRTQLFEVHGNRSIYHDGWIASAFHGRLPWSVGLVGKPTPFEADTWELYNLEEDFSQADDLAASHSGKLKQMQALFNKEAKRLGILPLRSALDTMQTAPLPTLVGDRTEFTYFPGAVGIPESEAPGLFNRSWTMQADIEAGKDGSAHGVIATMGGTVGGLSLYLDAAGRPVFEYRTFEVDRLTLKGVNALTGKQTVQVEFDYDGGGYGKGGRVSLKVDGREVANGRIAATPPAYFSIDETFDIGLDTGSPAGRYPTDAPLGYAFGGGDIEQVRIRLR